MGVQIQGTSFKQKKYAQMDFTQFSTCNILIRNAFGPPDAIRHETFWAKQERGQRNWCECGISQSFATPKTYKSRARNCNVCSHKLWNTLQPRDMSFGDNARAWQIFCLVQIRAFCITLSAQVLRFRVWAYLCVKQYSR